MYKGASKYLQHLARKAVATDKFKSRRQGVPRRLRRAFESEELVPGKLLDEVESGYIVEIYSYPAFCPRSEMHPRISSKKELWKLQRETLEFAVINVSFHSAIVSRKRAIRLCALGHVQDAFMRQLSLWGTMKSLQPYGAFVDLGGIDGLVHISEVNNGLIEDLSAVLKVGQRVKVVVIEIDEKGDRISLSMMRLGSHMKSE